MIFIVYKFWEIFLKNSDKNIKLNSIQFNISNPISSIPFRDGSHTSVWLKILIYYSYGTEEKILVILKSLHHNYTKILKIFFFVLVVVCGSWKIDNVNVLITITRTERNINYFFKVWLKQHLFNFIYICSQIGSKKTL